MAANLGMRNLSTRFLDCGRKPDPGRLRQVEECAGRLTVRAYLDGDAPPELAVDLVETRLHREGVRRWFACPGCGRRAGVLYRPAEGDPWACRRCHRLTYRSAQQAHRDVSLWVAERRIMRHLEANGGWPDAETFFDGLTWGQVFATFRVLIYWDLADLEARREALAAEMGAWEQSRAAAKVVDLSAPGPS